MIRHILTACAVIALSACASGAAPGPSPADTSMGPPPAKVAGYLGAESLDGASILGPPPAPDSAHGKADRAQFDETRALEGSPRWKTAIQDNDLWGGGALKRFSCTLGVDVGERQTPALMRILHKVELECAPSARRPRISMLARAR